MTLQTFVYFREKILGPYEKWEIKLLATKYRDFQIYIGNDKWVPFKQWDKGIPKISDIERYPLPPSNYMKKSTSLKRYIKRIIFKDHH